MSFLGYVAFAGWAICACGWAVALAGWRRERKGRDEETRVLHEALVRQRTTELLSHHRTH